MKTRWTATELAATALEQAGAPANKTSVAATLTLMSTLLQSPHVCKPATACICSKGARGPNEQCPEHGHPWPPRCDRGHFLKWETMAPPPLRRFVAYFYRVSWYHVNLGIHLDFKSPNIELHVPFGFFRLGWVKSVRIKTLQQVHDDLYGYEGPKKP